MNKPARALAGRFANSGQWLQLTATIVFAATLTVLLLLGMHRADELQSASSALQRASQLSTQPSLINAELTLLQRGLETTTYVGESLRTIDTLRENGAEGFASIQRNLQDAGLARDPAVLATLRAALKRWDNLERPLDELKLRRGNELYADSPSGSALSAQGKAMKAAVDELLATQSQNLQLMGEELNRLAAVLRTGVDDSGRSLRSLLLLGTAVAAMLLGLMLYYAWRSRQALRAARRAERQVSNILSTVREGLFLINRDLRLGDTCSESLRELLRLPQPAGCHLEEVLKPLVDAKTLTAAVKFLGLLWKDKVHEELIESVNPLSQIEVSFTNSRGGTDVRYLAFSFRRVRAAEAVADSILGVVADVTDRVLLARELEHAKADSDSQATVQLQLLRVDPLLLKAFLAAADVAFRKSNAVLTTSGIEQQDLKKKLNGVFRELHAVKGEAAALMLTTFVQRIHAIEEALSALRGKGALSGNDFLPVVVRLDELLSHLGQIRSMQERLATLRPPRRPSASSGEPETDNHRDTTVIPEKITVQSGAPMVTRPSPLTEVFQMLAAEVAKAQSRSVRLLTRGLEEVPPHYSGVVKDIGIQMIRNSVAHGIEPPVQRVQRGKPEAGTVQITFNADNPDDYLLTVEDDGHGLNYEQIVDKALRLELINPQQAVALDRAAVYRLIFLPGFSTAAEVSEHSGRGVGLDAVSNLVREHGGRIGVSTAAERYTRFRVLLPKVGDASLAASSAA